MNALSDQFTSIAPLAGSPQAFQVVKFARARRKNVNNEIDIVQKDPFSFRMAFHVQWAHTLLLESLLDVICNGLIVTTRSSGADEEVVSEGTDFAQFEDDRILGFLVECCFDCFG